MLVGAMENNVEYWHHMVTLMTVADGGCIRIDTAKLVNFDDLS